MAHRVVGETKEAISAYTEAVKLNPQNFRLYMMLGSLYARQEYYDEALNAYERAIELDPGNAQAYINRGIIYLQRPRPKYYEKALNNFNKALQIDPKNKNARQYLQQSLEEIQDETFIGLTHSTQETLEIQNLVPPFHVNSIMRSLLSIFVGTLVGTALVVFIEPDLMSLFSRVFSNFVRMFLTLSTEAKVDILTNIWLWVILYILLSCVTSLSFRIVKQIKKVFSKKTIDKEEDYLWRIPQLFVNDQAIAKNVQVIKRKDAKRIKESALELSQVRQRKAY